ncbi:MAG: hypothetical protein QOD07_2154 [Frankiaceae bacterium]|nr:hypothetical protein [Frankiaceae bacterium]
MKRPVTRAHERDAKNVVDKLARLGLASRGVVYLLIAWISVRIAMSGGGGGGEADRQGALGTFAHNTAGKAVLVVMAVGFLGYAVWRLTEAVWGHRDADGDASRWVKRGASFARAVLYGGFAWSAGRAAVSGGGGQGSNTTSKQATAGLLAHSGGRVAVVVLGVGFVVAGVVLTVRGVLRKFESKLRTGEMGEKTERVVAVLGVAGQTARGVVFGVVGGFFVDAAVSYDPAKAQGLDGALRSLARAPLGALLLAVVAAGLAAFGAYSLAEARYRET